jgi:hypothetical protein
MASNGGYKIRTCRWFLSRILLIINEILWSRSLGHAFVAFFVALMVTNPPKAVYGTSQEAECPND